MDVKVMEKGKARAWRIAVLNRARETNRYPDEIVEEFWPFMQTRPSPISKEEAESLAEDYPYSPERIFTAFSRELQDGEVRV